MKKIEDLNLGDIVRMPLFFENVEKAVKPALDERGRLRANGKKLKAHVIDELEKSGLFKNKEQFIKDFLMILDEKSTLNSRKRNLIKAIGLNAFHATMKKIIDDDNKRIDNSRKDK